MSLNPGQREALKQLQEELEKCAEDDTIADIAHLHLVLAELIMILLGMA